MDGKNGGFSNNTSIDVGNTLEAFLHRAELDAGLQVSRCCMAHGDNKGCMLFPVLSPNSHGVQSAERPDVPPRSFAVSDAVFHGVIVIPTAYGWQRAAQKCGLHSVQPYVSWLFTCHTCTRLHIHPAEKPPACLGLCRWWTTSW